MSFYDINGRERHLLAISTCVSRCFDVPSIGGDCCSDFPLSGHDRPGYELGLIAEGTLELSVCLGLLYCVCRSPMIYNWALEHIQNQRNSMR